MLRALAAINVVIFHSIGSAIDYGHFPETLAFLRGWGQNGVDLFFVISGFIMVYIDKMSPRGFWSFIYSRATRILPLYYITTFIFISIAIFIPQAFRELELNPTWVSCSFTLTCTQFYTSNPLVGVGWTLEYEMAFYLIFALILATKIEIEKYALTIAGILLATYLTGFGIMMHEFIFGIAAGALYFWLNDKEIQPIFLYFAIAIGAAFMAMPLFLEIEAHRVLIYGAPSFLIVLGSALLPQIKRGLASYLGDASYSIYLIQVLTIPAFYKFSGVIPLEINGDLLVILCVFSSVIAGVVLYECAERPSLRLARQWNPFRRKKTT